jgi:ABC-type nitrate/sulfonate/bicarbonate transport system substrate-binding protein
MSQAINVIAFPGAPNLPVFAAIEHGFFAAHDLEVSLTITPSSVYQMQAFHSGAFDLAFTACDNIVAYTEGQGAAALQGPVDFKVIMGATQVELSLVVNPRIQTAQDLRGQSLALDAVGTGFAFVCYEMLAQMGLPMAQYTRVPVGATPERWQSVKADQHAGTITIEPFTSLAQAAGFSVLRRSTEAFYAYPGGVVAARASWAAQHADAVRAFIKGYIQGLNWTLNPEHRGTAAQLLQARMPEIKPGVVDAVLNSLFSPRSGLTPRAAILRDGLQTVLDLRSRYGAPGVVLSDIDKYLDLSYYESVIL